MHGGYEIGDYVIVSDSQDESDFWQYTQEDGEFKVTKLTLNAIGQPLIKVVRIDNTGGELSFYPWELSYEDGTRPTTA